VTVNFFFYQTNRTATKFEGLDKEKRIINSLSNFYWLSSSALQNRYQGFPEVCPGPLHGQKTNWKNKTWTK